MPWLRSSANKVQTNVFCCCLIVNYGVASHRTCYTIVCRNRHGIFWGLIFGRGIFLGFAGSPRDFLGLDFWLYSVIPVTWNPEYPPGRRVRLKRALSGSKSKRLKSNVCSIFSMVWPASFIYYNTHSLETKQILSLWYYERLVFFTN